MKEVGDNWREEEVIYYPPSLQSFDEVIGNISNIVIK